MLALMDLQESFNLIFYWESSTVSTAGVNELRNAGKDVWSSCYNIP
jgi:hypothetical protein